MKKIKIDKNTLKTQLPIIMFAYLLLYFIGAQIIQPYQEASSNNKQSETTQSVTNADIVLYYPTTCNSCYLAQDYDYVIDDNLKIRLNTNIKTVYLDSEENIIDFLKLQYQMSDTLSEGSFKQPSIVINNKIAWFAIDLNNKDAYKTINKDIKSYLNNQQNKYYTNNPVIQNEVLKDVSDSKINKAIESNILNNSTNIITEELGGKTFGYREANISSIKNLFDYTLEIKYADYALNEKDWYSAVVHAHSTLLQLKDVSPLPIINDKNITISISYYNNYNLTYQVTFNNLSDLSFESLLNNCNVTIGGSLYDGDLYKDFMKKSKENSPVSDIDGLVYAPGIYRFGESLEPGDYFIISDNLKEAKIRKNSTLPTKSYFTSQISRVELNRYAYTLNHVLIRGKSQEYLILENAYLVKMEDFPINIDTANHIYKVGYHLDAGTYQIERDSSDIKSYVYEIDLSKTFSMKTLVELTYDDTQTFKITDNQYICIINGSITKIDEEE